MKESNIFKQRLYSIHSSLGIGISLFLYISLFFGIFTIFKPYIEVWEKPSRHFERINIDKINFEKILEKIISNPDYPKNNVFIELPGLFKDPSVKISHRFVKTHYFNPKTAEEIEVKNEFSYLGGFLNEMHFGKPLKFIGKIFFGIVAVLSMVLIIGGIMLLIYFNFKNDAKSLRTHFSLWHRKIFLYTSPIFFIIILTGALMNIGYTISNPLTSIVTKNESNDIVSYTSTILKPIEKPLKPYGKETEMMSILDLIKKANQINSEANFEEMKLINWKDTNARIQFIGYNPYKPFFNGVYNREKLTLNATNGEVIKDKRVFDSNWTILFADFFYYIHLLYNVDIFTRLIVAFLMIFSSIAIAFSLLLWLERKMKAYTQRIEFYHWMEKLSLSVVLGIIPSTGLLFLLQWLLPFDSQYKILIQQVAFFTFWTGTLTWSFYRINSYKVAKEFLLLGGVFFILSSLFHMIFSNYSIVKLYEKMMYDILGVDLFLITFGILMLYLSQKVPNSRGELKDNFRKNIRRKLK